MRLDLPPRLELSPRVAGALAIAWVAILVVALLVFLAGCGVPDASAPRTAGIVPVAPATTSPVVRVRPVAVSIPKLGVTSTLIETGILPDGTAETPPVEHPEQASWLRVSPVPGDPGPAVLYGHVDGHGRAGVFHDLGKLTDGDQIVVQRDGAPDVEFAVYGLREVSKSDFPAAEVYGDTPGAELRLVTCSGSFDRAAGHYRDNLVIFARLVPAAQPPVGTATPPTA